jgi:hypothetical protein
MLVFIGIRLGTERGVPNPRWIFFPFSWPHASAVFREIPRISGRRDTGCVTASGVLVPRAV